MITKQIIQRELLSELNKRKPLAIWLTVFLFVSIICYAIHIAYTNETDIQNNRLSFFSPCITLPIGALIILFLTIFLIRYYYLDFYKIKSGKIELTGEKLSQKAIENIFYFRRSKKENALFFRYGRVKVNETVYSYSNIGDSFYVVYLKSKKKPSYVYHTQYYEVAAEA